MYSIVFAANKLVKNTIAIGFEIARKNTEIKLQIIFVELISIVCDTLLNVPRIVIPPNMMSTIALIIPNIFLIFLFSRSFPRPNITSII